VLTNIYGTCNDQDIHNFINWLNSLHFEDEINWMLIWDFNFYRSLQDRNREGDNMQDIMVFNEIISNLGLQEIPLKGKNYIGSNMRQDPLLEQLDWCFTSTIGYLITLTLCFCPWPEPSLTTLLVKFKLALPFQKGKISRFENYWVEQPRFLEMYNLSGSLR
jgi:hypothetical protein